MNTAERIEYLEAQVEYYKGLLATEQSIVPTEWRLSRQQRKIAGCLMRRPMTVEQLVETLYVDQDETDSARGVIYTQTHYIRNKIAKFGYRMARPYGQPWWIERTV